MGAPEPSTPHLNVHGLLVCNTPDAGRGVFASRHIPANTVIEVSPVLLFGPDEYQAHGRHTILDSYTFVWEKRSSGSTMALALGLGASLLTGSLFNHDPHAASVSYELDRKAESIRYRTMRAVSPGDELCICYGTGRMWWENDIPDEPHTPVSESHEFAMLGGMSLDEPYTLRPPSIPSTYTAPLWRVTASPDPNTFELETSLAWAVDVPPRASAALVRAMRTLARAKKLTGSEANEPYSIKHLRSFRKGSEVVREGGVTGDSSLLVALVAMVEAHPDPAELRSLLESTGEELPSTMEFYQVRVPSGPAPNRARLAEWMDVWPCVFLSPGAGLAKKNSIPGSDAARAISLVDRAADNALWLGTGPDGVPHATAVEAALHRCLANAEKGRESGESVAVGVFVTSSSFAGNDTQLEPIEVDAWDTRTSERHPLRHAIPNAVRQVAARRATQSNRTDVANGQDYLLTGLTLFVTHEPCSYCAMALIHSRVRTVFFVQPTPGSGGFCGAHAGTGGQPQCDGCEDGGPFTVHEQSGLNHHYDVWRWIGPLPSTSERVALDV